MMGGKVAHEYMYVTDIGEDHLALCDGCGYAANREIATFRRDAPAGDALDVSEVATPEVKTIAALSAFLDVPESATAKAVMLMASFHDDRADALVLAIVRGDMELNEIPLAKAVGAAGLRPAQEAEITAAGIVAGYASAIGADRSAVIVVVDTAVAASTNLVAGANRDGFHLLNTNHGRDYTADHVTDIALAYDGAPCANCGAALRMARGVEVGNIFQLGTRYTDAVEASYLNQNGKAQSVVMGSYGIGVGRLLACVAEHCRDDNGLALPLSVAPFQVMLVALVKKAHEREAADALYAELKAAGIDVLYDERPKVSPGFKFAEADLRGLPVRVLISARNLKEGVVELKLRSGGEAWKVPPGEVVSAIRAELAKLSAENAAFVAEQPTWSD
jgi:prolyl-tRNA synthetase